MAEDLNLVGYRFNWALSVFYIIYLLVEVPSNIILKRVGPRFYIPMLVSFDLPITDPHYSQSIRSSASASSVCVLPS